MILYTFAIAATSTRDRTMVSKMAVVVQPLMFACSAPIAGCFQVQTKIGVGPQLLAEALTIVVTPLPSIAYISLDLQSIYLI
jgi:hypothetical protein